MAGALTRQGLDRVLTAMMRMGESRQEQCGRGPSQVAGGHGADSMGAGFGRPRLGFARNGLDGVATLHQPSSVAWVKRRQGQGPGS